MIPKKLARGRDPRVDRLLGLRERLPISIPSIRRYGGRTQLGKDHAQTTS
jgi:hypothetical protein